MNDIKVSIVVPIYNAGEYLYKCIDSLIGQTLKEIEIILVLDCPTDGSDKVAKEYAAKDSRIKIIENSENLHIGCSRNEGLRVAKGDFIGFSDHDDFCDEQMFEKLYNEAIKTNADVVVSDYCDENNGTIIYLCFPTGLEMNEFEEKILDSLISGRYSKPNVRSFDNVNVIWNQLYKKDFLNKNNIEFTDNRKITMEDVIFNIKTHFLAQETAYLPEILYHHVTNGQNEFQNYSYRAIDKTLPHIAEVYTFLQSQNVWKKYEGNYTICTLRRLYTSWRNEVKFKGLFVTFNFIKQIKRDTLSHKILQGFKVHKEWLKGFGATKKVFYKIIS